ncbi:MAG: T9SS type B sorting domain-containing protein [Nonlabens ulvanivorans]|uniref:T9SS type B sorting domain-containing protein n=1 Tax=Nonlabens ulvanivorans TaxID=906888 RepID=UPI0032987007
MKKNLLYICFLILSISSYSQNQANWWFFGNNSGLDFNTGTPIPNNLGQLSTNEGCASIADACGALLFYTDGITVWNQNHIVMPNGMNLLGDPSSSQSALIIPQPDTPDLYYIFTVGDFNPRNGLNYSVVDMTLNGGLGDIIPSQKNINLIADSTEKVAAAVTDNGDAWIVTYAEDVIASGLFDTFYAFKLTSSGMDLSATVTSTFNNVQADDRRGYLRISPDGSKIAIMTQLPVTPGIVGQTGRGAWLFDFDNSTGLVSNSVRLNFPLTHQAYGAEFSPDSRKIYVDINTQSNGNDGDRILLQYNLDAPNFEDNPLTIYSTDPTDFTDDVARGALQIDPDNKIYYSRKSTQWLSVINDPDQLGAASNFMFDGVQVATGTQVNEGLPPFYNAFFNPSFSFIEACETDASQFFADDIANCPGSSVIWDFGDPSSGLNNTSTLPDPTHIYNSAGTFNVTLSIDTIRGNYTTSKEITIVPQPVTNTVSDIIICDDMSNDGIATLDLVPIRSTVLGSQSSTDFQVTIHETLTDAQNDFNALPDSYDAVSGTYYARLDSSVSNGCYAITAFDIIINPLPIINNIDDLYLCDIDNDNVENFDLNIAGLQALGTQDPIVFDISYHNSMGDAMSNSNSISSFYDNNTINESIWLRIENVNNTYCYAIDNFTINLIQQPEINLLNDYELCDDESNDGIENFDLSTIDAQVLGNQPSTFVISYHNSMMEAEQNINALPNNIDSGTTMIWARLENNQQQVCYTIEPLQITVFPHPVVDLPENITKCVDDVVTIAATPGFNQYSWDSGETTRSINVQAAGNYTVTVTDDNGCTDTETITVSNYETTVITNIELRQFTLRDNRLEVSVTGSGPWEYSIDNFFYQSSPVFANLLPGYYDVYVRSLNGCDQVTAPATIIAAPNFFTPNQDGFHDYWQVIAIETEPDAQIFIFDRFGKLLKQLSPTGIGWDGTYNGNPMPSTDYWFKVVLNDGQSFRGHFSLKR